MSLHLIPRTVSNRSKRIALDKTAQFPSQLLIRCTVQSVQEKDGQLLDRSKIAPSLQSLLEKKIGKCIAYIDFADQIIDPNAPLRIPLDIVIRIKTAQQRRRILKNAGQFNSLVQNNNVSYITSFQLSPLSSEEERQYWSMLPTRTRLRVVKQTRTIEAGVPGRKRTRSNVSAKLKRYWRRLHANKKVNGSD